MVNYRVLLSFVSWSDSDLDEFAGNIVVSLTGNAAFPTPLVPLTALGAAQFLDSAVTNSSARF